MGRIYSSFFIESMQAYFICFICVNIATLPRLSSFDSRLSSPKSWPKFMTGIWLLLQPFQFPDTRLMQAWTIWRLSKTSMSSGSTRTCWFATRGTRSMYAYFRTTSLQSYFLYFGHFLVLLFFEYVDFFLGYWLCNNVLRATTSNFLCQNLFTSFLSWRECNK